MKNSYQNQVVWIVGASSGIGLALARELAARGAILALSARNQESLEALKAELANQALAAEPIKSEPVSPSKVFHEHKVFVLDITDADKVQRTAQAIRATFGEINRIIFLAAAYAPMNIDELDLCVTKNMIEVNLMGAFNLVHAALPILKSQQCKSQYSQLQHSQLQHSQLQHSQLQHSQSQHSQSKHSQSKQCKNQLVLCASVAGYMGLPGGQPYSATKAGIINLAESLYAQYQQILDIKLINPGFVRTPLTNKNEFSMPMIIEPEQAAKEIADGLLSNRFEIHFPRKFTRLLKMLRLLPYAWSLRLTRHIKT